MKLRLRLLPMKAFVQPVVLSAQSLRVLLVSSILWLGGCAFLPKAVVDPTRYYLLAATTQGGGVAVVGSPTVVLKTVELASYLKVRPLLVRKGGYEIEFKEYARWGEPLEQGITRVVREELAAGGVGVVAVGRAAGPEAAYELSVRVLACEGAADGAVNFRAIWRVEKAEGLKPVLASGDFRSNDLPWDGKSEASLAGQLSRAVVGLAVEVGTALKREDGGRSR